MIGAFWLCHIAHALSISFNSSGVVLAYAGAILLEGFDETPVPSNGVAFKEFKEMPGVKGTSKGSVRVYNNSVLNHALKPTNAVGQFLSIGTFGKGGYTLSPEPRRVCWRLFGLSHATKGRCSIMA